MQISTYTQVVTTVYFQPGDSSWIERNEKGYPFQVSQITYQSGEEVWLRGWAIRVDGSRGDIQRSAHRHFNSLPSKLFEQILASHHEAIEKVLAQVKEVR